jgi:hypothetical protein
VRRLGVAAALLAQCAAPPAFADWVRDPATGCEIFIDSGAGARSATWSGACRDGKAEGTGVMLADDGATFEGEFRAGEPFNGHGLEVYVTQGGEYTLANRSVTNGQSFVSRLKFEPGSGWLSAGYLAGEWRWRSDDGRCRETFRYQANFQQRVSSGKEVLDGVFELLGPPGADPGVFALRRVAAKSNGKRDCLGNTGELGVVRQIFLRFEGRDTFRTCGGPEAASCYGTARRIGAAPAASIEMTSRYGSR